MASFRCRVCRQLRAPSRRDLCSVCWLIEDLAQEHERGEHDAKVNVSCVACQPRHRRELREGEPGRIYRRLVNQSIPLTPNNARFLLRLDKEGFPAAARHGAKGSRVMKQLEDAGHLTVTWSDTGSPSLVVSARSRFQALTMLDRGDTPTTTIERVSGDPRRPKRAARSHASCTHESTPAARAKCRAERKD